LLLILTVLSLEKRLANSSIGSRNLRFGAAMTSAWTNMSIAIIHRGIERDGEIQCGVMGVTSWSNEQWSLWSTAHLEDCSLVRNLHNQSSCFKYEWPLFSHYLCRQPASDIREWEIEDLMGRIVDVELKIPPRPPCYCFVEFESSRDAEDAIRGRDGYNFDGCRLRVELAHGGSGRGPSSSDRRGGYGGGGGSSGGWRWDWALCYCAGLPSSASWQDLKDHMRKAGDVCFAEVSRDGDGTFGLIRKLDDTEFRNPWARAYIRVRKFEASPSRSVSRSRSRSRSPKRNRSKSVDRSSVSRSRSRSRSRSMSRSRSRSPSPAKIKIKNKIKIEINVKVRSRSRSGSPRPRGLAVVILNRAEYAAELALVEKELLKLYMSVVSFVINFFRRTLIIEYEFV
ncbi:hypothetical protein F8388_006371, partial [Cannabis sativa]